MISQLTEKPGGVKAQKKHRRQKAAGSRQKTKRIEGRRL
jgi:hypothetical protein